MERRRLQQRRGRSPPSGALGIAARRAVLAQRLGQHLRRAQRVVDALAGDGVGQRGRVADERPARRPRSRGSSAGPPRARGWCARSARPPRRRRAGNAARDLALAGAPSEVARRLRGRAARRCRRRRGRAAGRATGSPRGPGVKRTTISRRPGANQPAAMVSRAGGVGTRNVRRTRLPAPSAPTTTSKGSSRPGACAARPPRRPRSRARPRAAAPAAVARRSSQRVEVAARRDRDRPRRGRRRPRRPGPDSKRQRSTRRAGQRVVRGRRRAAGASALRGEPAAARLLARMGGVEERRRTAPSRARLPREERARGARAHDRDLHAGSPAADRRSTSSGLAVAVPSLPTTTPAA